jgi:hypothetical protein
MVVFLISKGFYLSIHRIDYYLLFFLEPGMVRGSMIDIRLYI